MVLIVHHLLLLADSNSNLPCIVACKFGGGCLFILPVGPVHQLWSCVVLLLFTIAQRSVLMIGPDTCAILFCCGVGVSACHVVGCPTFSQRSCPQSFRSFPISCHHGQALWCHWSIGGPLAFPEIHASCTRVPLCWYSWSSRCLSTYVLIRNKEDAWAIYRFKPLVTLLLL